MSANFDPDSIFRKSFVPIRKSVWDFTHDPLDRHIWSNVDYAVSHTNWNSIRDDTLIFMSLRINLKDYFKEWTDEENKVYGE